MMTKVGTWSLAGIGCDGGEVCESGGLSVFEHAEFEHAEFGHVDEKAKVAMSETPGIETRMAKRLARSVSALMRARIPASRTAIWLDLSDLFATIPDLR